MCSFCDTETPNAQQFGTTTKSAQLTQVAYTTDSQPTTLYSVYYLPKLSAIKNNILNWAYYVPFAL